jgi:two-component system chemotaxis sensor kinase CheA
MSIDLAQFHHSFFEESFEAVTQMERALLGLSVGAADPELVNTIFRVAHSIKGGASMFGFAEIASFTHTLETVLDELRAQRLQVTTGLADLLLRSVDVTRAMLRAQQNQQPIDAQRVTDLQFDLELAVAQKRTPAAAPATTPRAAAPERRGPEKPAAPPPQQYRIEFRPLLHLLARGNDPLRLFRELRALGELSVRAELEALPALEALDPVNCHLAWSLDLTTTASSEAVRAVFDWAEGDCKLDITPVRPAADTAAAVLASEPEGRAAPHPELPRAAEASSLRVSVEKIDDLMNRIGELVITQSMLDQFGPLLQGPLGERLRAGLSQLERNVRELQESVMRVRMVPISFVFSRFPRMVRDLSQRLGKQVELKLTGSDTELDKTVLEKIGDPLLHLVRNGIDHGIERPEDRLAGGKPAHGTLHLHAYHRGGSIAVEVSDDGAGLRRGRILAKARALGLISPEAVLDDAQICQLVLLPGFSTTERATDVSGRGVGLDVVKRNVEELGGSIELRSTEGQGSLFSITLPLTLAILDGQTVGVGDECYIVPLTAIVESLQMRTAAVKHVIGHGEVLAFRGQYLPVVRLHQFFGTPGARADDQGLIMVVEGDGRRVGLYVDELLGQQQVVVKTLAANYGHVEGIAGATILGDGSVALILDIAGLGRAAAESRAA